MSLNETPEESIFTINFRKAWITPEYRRTNRVVGIMREFAKRHMKSDDIKIDQYLNRYLWQNGKRNPPRKVRVRMTKDETDTVVLSLYEEFKERKSEIGDLQMEKEAKSPEKEPTEEKKEGESKDEGKGKNSLKKESKDVTPVESDHANKEEVPELKITEKPKRKYTRKKKTADQEP